MGIGRERYKLPLPSQARPPDQFGASSRIVVKDEFTPGDEKPLGGALGVRLFRTGDGGDQASLVTADGSKPGVADQGS